MNITLFDGRILYNTHSSLACFGETCVFHRPTDHPLLGTPFGMDSRMVMTHICTHGIEHPDPDSLTWYLNDTRGLWPETSSKEIMTYWQNDQPLPEDVEGLQRYVQIMDELIHPCCTERCCIDKD